MHGPRVLQHIFTPMVSHALVRELSVFWVARTYEYYTSSASNVTQDGSNRVSDSAPNSMLDYFISMLAYISMTQLASEHPEKQPYEKAETPVVARLEA